MRHFIKKRCSFLFSLFILFSVFFPSIKTNAQSVGGTTSGGALYCAGDGNGFVNLDAGTFTGSILNWESSTDGGATWTTIFNITASQSYSGLTQTTCYRAIVKDGAFPPDTSTISCINIYAPSVGGVISGAGTFCIVPGSGAGVLSLTASTQDTLYWQYSTNGGVSWTSLPDTGTTINYPNINQNTLYWAIVRNGPAQCISDTSAQVSFTFDSLSVAGTITSSDTVCPGINSGTINLTGKVGGVLSWLSSTDNSIWVPISNTDTSQAYNGLTQTTFYEVVVQNGACPADTSTSIAITIITNPVSAGNDTVITLGQSVILNGTGNGTALWTPSAGLDSAGIFKPTATPTTTTLYTLTVTDNNSCISVDSVLITIFLLEFDGVITNLFTPNGDGINDMWYIKDIEKYPSNEVFIYNIYGNLVYTKKAYANDWKGTYNGAELPDGTYYYVLRFDETDKITKGAVDILRSK